ncbi:BolA family transcriptional regulator [soil metagenome]|uniref:BolA family protein n=1 Tax=Sphingobium sp. BS19 TaxID=3018973 RepID=UPI0022EF6374|nr:BolA family transcriptional regulator [Sphingobium sp. BS19]GLI99557.1 ATP-binding protein [Sphingobium sp. BS19]
MPMAADDITAMIQAAIPDAQVEITDLAGDGDHYSARVVSESFRGVSRVKQHQAVYAALGGKMGGVLHALQLTTAVPN